jgi:hypothetical protein
LLGLGLGRGAIQARLASGAYRGTCPGVYGVGPERKDPPALAWAAVLACGDGALLSHASALSLWGMISYWDLPLHLTVAGDRRPRGVTVHRCRTLTASDRRVRLSIPVTSPARTLLDIASDTAPRRLSRLVNDARRARLLALAELTDVLGRNPYHPGTKHLMQFTDRPANPTRSTFEDDFLAFVRRYGLPVALINHVVLGHERDAVYPEQKVIVELDGWEFHKDRLSFNADRARDKRALQAGWVTVRITYDGLHEAPDDEAATLRAILDDRGAQGPPAA